MKNKYSDETNNSYTKVQNILKKNKKYFEKNENGEEVFLRNIVSEDARKNDADLLKLLYSDSNIKNAFFDQISKDVWNFNDRKFLQLINNKEFLPDSYTAFKNQIGLADEQNHFIKANNGVVLNFPYKDCVLEGGMTKEDVKTNEIMINEVLENDKIDRLLDEKAITNVKEYGANSVIDKVDFKRGKNGTIKDNLIIKGNNLLALHTLKSNFTGKVKLIYIDPPYNTGNDSFNYNDNFNHSTWLTFMKNRLEVSKDLLSDDGVIFVHCDDNEQAYLKVLMDEIFGRDNFVGTLIHQRAKGGGQAKHIVKGHDYVCIFSKNLTKKQKFIREKVIQSKIVEKDGVVCLRNDDVVRKVFGKYSKDFENRRCFYEELQTYKNKEQISKIQEKIDKGFYVLEKLTKNKSVIVEYKPVENAYSKIYSIINALSTKGTEHLEELGLAFDRPKPEEIIDFIIHSVTKKGDIVLDYHLGSGTTCAVAHKRGRQYIGVEQMDYIEDIAVERLKKVIAGEQGGISKDLDWKGGGEFIYFELAKYNQKYIDELTNATDKTILKLYDKITTKAFLNYQFKEKEFNEKLSNFKKLSIKCQKQILSDILDKNQLYINYSEIKDNLNKISENDKELNRQFYDK